MVCALVVETSFFLLVELRYLPQNVLFSLRVSTGPQSTQRRVNLILHERAWNQG